jgi:hypothetical protein
MDEVIAAQAAINAHIEANALEFGLHIRQGGWRMGLLVACSVEMGKGSGVKWSDRSETEQAAHELRASSYELAEKVSAGEFAKLSGASKMTVTRYYKAWNKAADDSHVPHSSKLHPGDTDLSTLIAARLPDWGGPDGYLKDEPSKEIGVQPIAPSNRSRPQQSDMRAWGAEAVDALMPVEEVFSACGPKGLDEMDWEIMAASHIFQGMITSKEVWRLNQHHLDKVITELRELLAEAERYKPVKGKSKINWAVRGTWFIDRLKAEITEELLERSEHEPE